MGRRDIGNGPEQDRDQRHERNVVPVIIAAIVAVIVLVVGVVAWGVLMPTHGSSGGTGASSSTSIETDSPNRQGAGGADSSGTSNGSSSSSGSSSTSDSSDGKDGGASDNAEGTSSGDADTATAKLPFTITGAPANATPQSVSATGDPVALKDSWTFGGNYANIGSIPVDADTAFGSFSETPDDVYSYAAALIGRNGPTVLETAPTGENAVTSYFEPQDGSGDAHRLVWRAASISRTGQSTIDNWQVRTWDASTRKTTLLGSAQAVNNRADTPTTGAMITPTANKRNAYTASNVAVGGGWTEKVLAFALDGSTGEAGRAVADGGYPAATDDGVVYASALRSGDAVSADGLGSRLYGSVSQMTDTGADAGKAKVMLTMEDKTNEWGICGIQAHGNKRAVAFCNAADGSAGAWIGLWDGGFATNKAWLHVASPTVALSLNGNWVVWGSGSQADDPGMFAYRWSDGAVDYLGKANGYSRPAIASDSDVVMVPVSHGDGQAVSFTVGRLE